MSDHSVQLVATEGVFKGLASQNMLFHQCLVELIDNAIAAVPAGKKFRVDIFLAPHTEQHGYIDVYLADNCSGMSLDHLKAALQLGESATHENRLNEHGFGLKNALATLSGKNGSWKMWTKQRSEETICSVTGPFKPVMSINDDDSFPDYEYLPPDISTLIYVTVKLEFAQTLQGRGAPAKDLAALRSWLVEHLGVMYRGYLEQNLETLENDGAIAVAIQNDSIYVPPIAVPLGNADVEYFEVELGGRVYPLRYVYGVLDQVKRDTIVRGNRAKFYYQGNQPTQGIDIRLGKRVIATRQFETIWKTDDGLSQLQKHNKYNDFVGELLIPELPRGVLSTVNTKTDFNLDDPEWGKIFTILNGFRPKPTPREESEKELRNKWVAMLRATNPDEVISDETSVWPIGTKIDVYRKTTNDKIIIYELKVGTGAPIHLYQLKMYWDGLVLDKHESPGEAILLVEDFNTKLEEMANMMNRLPVPEGSKAYNFKVEKLSDRGLMRAKV